LTGIRFKGRQVRCNDADEGGKPSPGGKGPAGKTRRSERPRRGAQPKPQKQDDWRSLIAEEGWAMRRPRKKK